MADDTPNHTGGMIALIPESPAMLAVPGGEPVEEIHLTLAYLGDDVANDLGPEVQAALAREVGQFAASIPPVVGGIFGHASWNPDSDDGPAVVYQLRGDNNLLQEAHEVALMQAREQIGAAKLPQQHTPWLPHVTAGYGIDPSTLTYAGPVRFSTLRLAWGDDVHDFPLLGVNMMEDQPLLADGGTRVDVEFPALVVEGMPTGDGREIAPGALTHRALPFQILAQTQNPVGGGGHDGAYVVGQLEHLERVPGPEVVSRETGEPFPEGTFVWRGKGWVNPNVPGGDLVAGTFNEDTGKWEGGVLIGNSADLTELEAEFTGTADESGVSITAGKISATTIVPIPAFAEAYVVVDGNDMTQAATQLADVEKSPAWRSDELGDDTCLPCATEYAVKQEKRDRAEKEGHALPGGRYPIENRSDLDNAISAVGRAEDPDGNDDEAERNRVRRHIIKQAKRLKLENMIPDNWKADGTLKASLLASASQLLPPAWMFDNPELSQETPLTIEEHDGWRHVYGHLAPWGVCHTGILGQCRTAPKTTTDYAYFHVGAVRAAGDDGPETVPVGHITMGTGHADSFADAADAAAHYDNTGSVVADIACGEDAHGIWFSGALRRKANADDEAALLAAPLSGDWRPVQEGMELVAALAVNVPGFPVQRVKAMVASGAVTSLQITYDRESMTHREPGAGATGAVMLDYDQLADRLAERLRDRGVELPPGAGDDPDAVTEEAEEQAYALGLRARRATAMLALTE